MTTAAPSRVRLKVGMYLTDGKRLVRVEQANDEQVLVEDARDGWEECGEQVYRREMLDREGLLTRWRIVRVAD